MSGPNLTAQDLLAWLEKTSSGWRQLLTRHPELLATPCDIMEVATAGQLLQHIVAVELRYAERLADLPPTDYSSIPYDSAESLYAIHDRAITLLKQLLATDIDWDAPIEFATRTMGPARSTRKTIFFHALLHGIRHYAQLATLARQHGIKPDWPMDYLLMDIEPV
ncbi:DinB family protein [Granulicella sp. S190]|uniref:DinB family protein n=1 Tax=Granulicella sp. S190 TaxID=1747226 RepID=UPI00131D4A26|nr:DinB family protein [Granulicella sp. S190]